MKPLGIERQTLLVALVPIILMTVLLESYFVYSKFADMENSLLERSQMMVRQMATSSEYSVFSGNSALLQQNIDGVLALQDVSKLAVLDKDGRLLMGGAGRGREQYEAMLAKANRRKPLYSDDDVLMLYEPIVATEIKLDALDFETNAQPAAPLGAVIIEISKQRLSMKKREMLLYSLAGALVILAATMLLALSAARRITRPIMGMSQSIRSFGEGGLDTRISTQSGVLELDSLINGFNQMADQLQHGHKLLEGRVADRTAALAASELQYRTLIENTPDTIARYDRECRRIYVNHTFGAVAVGGADALLGKKPSENPGGANSIIYETKINEVFSTGNNTQFELRWRGKDDREICSHIRLTAEYDPSGHIVSVLGVERDISELHEYRAELQRKEQAKSRFLAAAGHDLRQPLAAANLFIGVLKSTKPTSEQAMVIQYLDQTMATFDGLLDSLLNISRLDSGVIIPEYTLINVLELSSWLEQNFAPLAKEKKLKFMLHFPKKELLIIQSDINLIKSVLANLAGNAIKYTLKGGILVSVRRRGNEVLFQVWDTGIGISNEHKEKIFDEFYQINNQQRDRKGGMGLGLSIAKRSIAILGSRITFRSKTGKGSVFEFQLPLHHILKEMKPEVVEDLRDDMPSVTSVQGKRFVVLEDDLLVAHALTIYLQSLGVDVEYFRNAEDALNNKDIEDADFFIVDHMLGGALNGIQFLNLIRQMFDKPINAILVTGDTSTDFIRDAVNSDWPVLHKPVNMDKLIATFIELEGRRV